ncbi:MAG TPA: hypothetical protein VFY39_04005, partial [Gammaproteobacteria bacterium]|nr:hypothetical protein [Gammaproteobacteria bacterium]
CSYNVGYLRSVMERLGLGDRWIYRSGADGSYHGKSEREAREICAGADVMVNVSGACWLRPEYRRIPRKIFIDSDPMFTQVGLTSASPETLERLHAHDFHFTFAENIGQPDCRIPALGFRWIPTRQPIVLDWWPRTLEPPRSVWTTVMNWVSYKGCEYAGDTWGQKDVEFMRCIDLPRRTAENFEVAMGLGPGKKRPTELLRQKGWHIVEPDQRLPDPWTYHDYLRSSKGEWSIAKEGYVKSRSGWFSCRSACYLASGRPCVLLDTAWSRYYPTGEGLLAFNTVEEAAAGVDRVAANYEAHCEAAHRVAAECFDAGSVLGAMLEHIGG